MKPSVAMVIALLGVSTVLLLEVWRANQFRDQIRAEVVVQVKSARAQMLRSARTAAVKAVGKNPCKCTCEECTCGQANVATVVEE
jgi:hypothetical protein